LISNESDAILYFSYSRFLKWY